MYQMDKHSTKRQLKKNDVIIPLAQVTYCNYNDDDVDDDDDLFFVALSVCVVVLPKYIFTQNLMPSLTYISHLLQ